MNMEREKSQMQKERISAILIRNMDIEHFKHRHYRPSLIVSLFLSLLIVGLASMLGRSTLKLTGAILLDEPKEITVIALVEPKLADGVHISEVIQLRKEDAQIGQKPSYTYHVRTSDESDYFTRIVFDASASAWTLERFEKLYGSDDAPTSQENQ